MIHINKIDRNEALKYMGINKSKNVDIDNIKPLLDKCENILLNTAKYRYCYKLFDIDKSKNNITFKGTELVLTGNDIFNHLTNCNKAVLMACTLSEGIDRLISKLNITDMTSAFITDTMASALIEQLCDEVEVLIKKSLSIKKTMWRFSPGYGDLPIDVQKKFVKVLNADKQIGLTVTDTNLLIPRKSVTAIIGITNDDIPQKMKACDICAQKEGCQLRKRGIYCGH